MDHDETIAALERYETELGCVGCGCSEPDDGWKGRVSVPREGWLCGPCTNGPNVLPSAVLAAAEHALRHLRSDPSMVHVESPAYAYSDDPSGDPDLDYIRFVGDTSFLTEMLRRVQDRELELGVFQTPTWFARITEDGTECAELLDKASAKQLTAAVGYQLAKAVILQRELNITIYEAAALRAVLNGAREGVPE